MEPEVGLLEGIATTRAIRRRYREEPIPPEALQAICFAASRAPSGSNRQPFRLLVLTDGPKARRAKALIGESARALWAAKRQRDGYDEGSGVDDSSPKARLARTMQHYVDSIESVPAMVLPCLLSAEPPTFTDGASLFPACQNLLLAARSLGYGGVLTGWHHPVESELRAVLEIPTNAHIGATITLGRPVGGHGPVRRVPLDRLVFEDGWGASPSWAVDPPDTQHTTAGPPDTGARHGVTD